MYQVFSGLNKDEVQAKIDGLSGMYVADIGCMGPSGKMYVVAVTGTAKTYKFIVGIDPEDLQKQVALNSTYFVRSIGAIGTQGELYALMESGSNITHRLYMGVTMEELADKMSNAGDGYVLVDTDAIGTSGWMYALMYNRTALQTKTATANGDVTADSGYDALTKVTVAVPLQDSKTAIANGDVTPDSGYTAMKKVVVAIPTEEITKTTAELTAGTVITPSAGKYISKLTVTAAS